MAPKLTRAQAPTVELRARSARTPGRRIGSVYMGAFAARCNLRLSMTVGLYSSSATSLGTGRRSTRSVRRRGQSVSGGPSTWTSPWL